MSYTEAKRKINEIKESTKSYQVEVNKVQNELLELSGDIGKIKSSVNSDLHEETIASYTSSAASEIVNKINSALAKSGSSLSGLSTDATNEIKKIVDAHNNSIDPESENPEPRLEYETISLTSVAGVPDIGDEGDDAPKGPRNYGPSNDPTPEYSFEYYFSALAAGNINSSDIDGWNDYVKQFLKENNLESIIKTIIVENGVFKCILRNGKTYTIKGVTTPLGLLKQLQKAIDEDNENNTNNE